MAGYLGSGPVRVGPGVRERDRRLLPRPTPTKRRPARRPSPTSGVRARALPASGSAGGSGARAGLASAVPAWWVHGTQRAGIV